MKVVIPGGSGQVGTILARAFHEDGHDVVVLSRRPDIRPWRVIAWDGATLGDWQREIDGCDVVINLAGRSVNCRYTARIERRSCSRACCRRAQLDRRSPGSPQATRVATSEHRHDLCASIRRPERRDVGYSRRTSRRAELLELQHRSRKRVGARFEKRTDGTRKIALRSAMTMSPDPGGVFDALLGLAYVFMRTETELILKSRRVVPARLLEHGFKFRYPDWRDAARDLCRNPS